MNKLNDIKLFTFSKIEGSSISEEDVSFFTHSASLSFCNW
jgi:hypothetical protein